MSAVDGHMFTEFLQVDPYTLAEPQHLTMYQNHSNIQHCCTAVIGREV